MGIYLRKKKNYILRNVIYSLLIILIIIISAYYFLISDTEVNLSKSDNKINQTIEDTIKVSNDTNTSSLNKLDLDEYVKIEVLDKKLSELINEEKVNDIVKSFIDDNPEFILEVLKNYQNEQNKIEQEKVNKINLSNIEKIYSIEHPMFLGNKDSQKKIFEFVDYNCGYCVKFHEEVKKVMKANPDLQLVIIQMPILGKMSEQLSKIAIAASLQGKFEEVHNYLYSSNRKSKIEDVLADLFLMNIDLSQLKIDLENKEINDIYTWHKSFVNDFKFSGTPAIIIGNTIVPGFVEAEKIIEILEKEFS